MYLNIRQLTSTKFNIELKLKNNTYIDNFTSIFCNFNVNVKVSDRVNKVRIHTYFGQKTNPKVLFIES